MRWDWWIYGTLIPVMVSDAYLFLHIFNREGNASAKESRGTSRNVINPYGRCGNDQTFPTGFKPIAVRNPYKKMTTINHCSTSLQDNIFDKKVVSASVFDYLTRDQDDGRGTILTCSFLIDSFFPKAFFNGIFLGNFHIC